MGEAAQGTALDRGLIDVGHAAAVACMPYIRYHSALEVTGGRGAAWHSIEGIVYWKPNGTGHTIRGIVGIVVCQAGGLVRPKSCRAWGIVGKVAVRETGVGQM